MALLDDSQAGDGLRLNSTSFGRSNSMRTQRNTYGDEMRMRIAIFASSTLTLSRGMGEEIAASNIRVTQPYGFVCAFHGYG